MSIELEGRTFISGKLRMKSKAVTVSMAVSFFIIIIALAVAAGFRQEIRKGVSGVCGDLRIIPVHGLSEAAGEPIDLTLPVFDSIAALDGVKEVRGVIYRGGMVRSGDDMHGALFRAVANGSGELADSVVTIPSKLASLLRLKPSDRVVSYFVGESVSARKFTVGSLYDGIVTDDDKLVVHCSCRVLQRLNAWDEGKVSAVEVILDDDSLSEEDVESVAGSIDELLYLSAGEGDNTLRCERIRRTYSTLFEWLGLVDSNVVFLLCLMIIVASFNMITGLLVFLFENMKNIGLLKSLGMGNAQISGVFLLSASGTAFVGMLVGNIAAFAFCLLQSRTLLLRLNPDNYFISFVPVALDVPTVLLVDAGALALVVLSLVIPCHFISRIQPSVILRSE